MSEAACLSPAWPAGDCAEGTWPGGQSYSRRRRREGRGCPGGGSSSCGGGGSDSGSAQTGELGVSKEQGGRKISVCPVSRKISVCPPT